MATTAAFKHYRLPVVMHLWTFNVSKQFLGVAPLNRDVVRSPANEAHTYVRCTAWLIGSPGLLLRVRVAAVYRS